MIRQATSTTVTIIVAETPAGYRVWVSPDVEGGRYELSCPTRWAARSFARGVSMGMGWPIEDRTAQPIAVEQLSASQWHAVHADGRCCVGVGDYVSVLAAALLVSGLYGRHVVSVDLDGTRLVLAQEETRHG